MRLWFYQDGNETSMFRSTRPENSYVTCLKPRKVQTFSYRQDFNIVSLYRKGRHQQSHTVLQKKRPPYKIAT